MHDSSYTVTMVGDDAIELEVGGIGGGPNPPDDWGSAIRAAWVRLGVLSPAGWTAARVSGPFGVVVHLHVEDKRAHERTERARHHESEKQFAGNPKTPLFDDEPDEPEDS